MPPTAKDSANTCTATDKGTQGKDWQTISDRGPAGLMQRDTEKDTQQSAKDGKPENDKSGI